MKYKLGQKITTDHMLIRKTEYIDIPGNIYGIHKRKRMKFWSYEKTEEKTVCIVGLIGLVSFVSVVVVVSLLLFRGSLGLVLYC